MSERRTLTSHLGDAPLTDTTTTGIDYRPVAVMPDVKVVKIGGQSVMDRGREAVFPILDEVVAAREAGVPILICAGGGTRARHIYAVASELEMPTGVLAALGSYVPRQNARMLQMLLASHGGLYIDTDDFEKLPLYIQLGCLPIMTGMPPFGYWEKRGPEGRVPPNRTDAGAFLSAEFLGAPRVIYIKDEDGLFTDDPKKNPDAVHIPRISAQELIARDLVDVVIERVCIDYLLRARAVREIQVVNGLVPGQVRAALAGEDVGSIIYHEG
ncbi:uridine kinase [Haliangium sp.]|uniref:amino acid kinase family protein n=1 Tax=Haliangium sp. TaxID=2663208 RepID=UPI003D1062CD